VISLRPLFDLDGAGLAALLDEGRAEGFRFLERLATEWSSGELRFQRPGEVLLAVYDDAQPVAVGGLTADPYAVEPAVGRLRRVYVRRDVRRQGVGRRLVRALEAAAADHYRRLMLRTDTVAAARFYEALGYAPLPPGGPATHHRWLDARAIRRDDAAAAGAR
jgi:GNAT superfamily N-acetyltransferase